MEALGQHHGQTAAEVLAGIAVTTHANTESARANLHLQFGICCAHVCTGLSGTHPLLLGQEKARLVGAGWSC